MWFRVPADRGLELRGEPFASCAIVPAMKRSEPLVLPDNLPLCPQFIEGAHEYMQVVRWWSAEVGARLSPVPIVARESPAGPVTGRVAFFSGGIDGLYTMLEARDRLDAAVFCHGIDFQLGSELAESAFVRNREWLATHSMPLWPMSSNARFVGHQLGVRWNTHNGACLAGFGHAFRAERVLIAAGHAWMDYCGGGTHPLSETRLSSAATTIEHHGYGPMRWQKLERVAQAPGALDLVRVCWQDVGYNCGRCEKCRRTMLLLHLLGLETDSFPPTRHLHDVLPETITDWEGLAYMNQALVLARRRRATEAVRLITGRIRRWKQRRWLARADQAFLGGLLARLRS
jgi:hypothetical protein